MSPRSRLFALSCLLLFLELALIRWTGSHVLYLSYFSNFVLLGSFLGIGLGFLWSRTRTPLLPWAPLVLLTLVAFVFAFPVRINRTNPDVLYFGSTKASGLPIWLSLPLIFLAVAATMATVADGLARVFGKLEPLRAYRVDVLGSLAGITLISLLAFLRAPPAAWGAVAVALLASQVPLRARPIQIAALVGILVVLGTESLTHSARGQHDSWSPYYRVSTVSPEPEVTLVGVNGIPHQVIAPVSLRIGTAPEYFAPYFRTGVANGGDVLVIGAGGGTDVAVALRAGARRVDAVEIDPRLYELGRQLNPDHPYSNDRVHVHIGDGRAFLQRTGRKFDLVLFALPDSLTLVAGQSSIRLESYLFTQEAIEQARTRLRPDGVFAMYNQYREEWLVNRFAGTLSAAFGHAPCVDRVHQGYAVLTVARDPANTLSCDSWTRPAGTPPPAHDDHPFPYLKKASIPSVYLITLALILAVSALATYAVARPAGSEAARYLDLGLMGAAFLLLETKNVVQFALLFGTTWFVNALVFAGILLTVLAAIEVAGRLRSRRLERAYALVFVALLVAWLVPVDSLLGLAPVPRFLAAAGVGFGPVFAANLAFAERFRTVSASPVAFGVNLLGAMVGGVLEYAALVIGYRDLLLVAALLYALAYVAWRRRGPEPVAA